MSSKHPLKQRRPSFDRFPVSGPVQKCAILLDAGIEENRAFLNWTRDRKTIEARSPLFQGMLGAHASFTLSDESLDACAEFMRVSGAGLHIHAAEDLCDVEDAKE